MRKQSLSAPKACAGGLDFQDAMVLQVMLGLVRLATEKFRKIIFFLFLFLSLVTLDFKAASFPIKWVRF